MTSAFPRIIDISLHRSWQASPDNASISSKTSKHKDIPQSNASDDDGDATAPPRSSSDCVPNRSDSSPIPVKLRCGVQPQELRAIWQLHMQSFPIEYNRDYYRWLTGPLCLSVVALVTPEAYQALQQRTSHGGGRQSQRRPSDEGHLDSVTQLSAAQRLHTDPFAEGDPKVQKIRAETDEMIRELEYATAAAEEGEMEGTVNTAELTHSAHSKDATEGLTLVKRGDSEENYSVVIGLAAGELSYAQHRSGHLLTDPTCYLCSLAVDPVFRGFGLGDALLTYFINYVANVPIHASSYLHYNPTRIRELLKTSSSFTEAFVRACWPPNDGESGLKEQANTAIPTKRKVQKESGVIKSVLEYVGLKAPSWLEARRGPQKWRVKNEASDEARWASNVRTTELDIVLQEFASLEGDGAGQDPVVRRGVREVWLHCIASDAFLMKFYTRRGFQLMSTLKDFYQFGSLSFDANFLLYTTEPSSRGGPPANTDLESRGEVAQQKGSCNLRMRHESIQKASSTLSQSSAEKPMKDQLSASEATATVLPLWLTPAVYKDVVHIVLDTLERTRTEWGKQMVERENKAAIRLPDSDTIQEIFFTCNALLAVLTMSWVVYNFFV